MKRRTKLIIISAAVFFAAAVIFGCILLIKSGNASVATVKSNGNTLYTIDLSSVGEPYYLDVKCESGYNKILVEKGKISVCDADCPDKICINQSVDGIYPIVCLPHRLVIEVK